MHSIFAERMSKNDQRNGVISVALVHRQNLIGCKLLKRLVPRAGVEPARPFGQRILSPLKSASPSLTKRYEPVFTGLAVVKVSLRLVTYQHVPPPSWPHLESVFQAGESGRRGSFPRH